MGEFSKLKGKKRDPPFYFLFFSRDEAESIFGQGAFGLRDP